jgi:NTE family protein
LPGHSENTCKIGQQARLVIDFTTFHVGSGVGQTNFGVVHNQREAILKQRTFDHEILLLQGGGALGAYQAGVYEGLVEAGMVPSWIVGISIGSINAAIIAGNPPERRIERLREFWRLVSEFAPLTLSAWLDPMRSFINSINAMNVAAFGIPCFFKPRMPGTWLAPNGMAGLDSIYDTLPLKRTLEELVDFDLINRRVVRLSLGAVNVRTGASVYFDNNHGTCIGPDHVRASGALPPGFPPVDIDGEYYWDGGLVSNSPLTYVWDERPLTAALIIEIDVFNAKGKVPRNLNQVMERAKDIQYASKMRFNIQHTKEILEMRASLGRVLARLPSALKADPDAKKLATLCDDREWTIARLINRRPSLSGSMKDYEFSRATVDESWAAGLDDLRLSLRNREWIEPQDIGPGVKIYDLPPDDSVAQK